MADRDDRQDKRVSQASSNLGSAQAGWIQREDLICWTESLSSWDRN